MRKRKIFKNGICLLFVLLLSCSSAGHVRASSISDAQKEREKLESRLEEAEALIDSLSDSKEDMEANVRALDAKLAEISEQIAAVEAQLAVKESEISNTQEALTAAQADANQQYEDMKIRIRFLYENSTQSALVMLLSANSFSDLLNRAEYIRKMTQYDRDMLKKYEDTVEEVANLEANLEAERTELTALKERVEQEQKAVAALLGEKEKQLYQIDEELTEAEQLAQVYEAEIQAQNEIIAMIRAEEERRKAEEQRRKEEEEARREEENNSDGESGGETAAPPEQEQPSYNGGIFTWPCPSSTRITSDYGPRNSPTAGASSYHQGLDIAAAYGADIVAAADGVVSFAGYSYASGNYLTISHGNGLYTVYMHCSSLVAAAGDSVSAGQTVAKIGSTGISTGNHLHFGVSLNGSYVSPWDYLK